MTSWVTHRRILPALLVLTATAAGAATDDLDAFVGSYSRYAGGPELSVTSEGSELVFRLPGGPRGEQVLRGVRQEGERFRLQGAGAAIEVTFTPSADGGYESFELLLPGRKQTLTRKEVLEARYRETAGEMRPNALADAVLMGDIESAKKLIAAGADVEEHDRRLNVAGPNGRRPLNWAALKNDTAMIELLLDAGAGINLTNYRSGWTPLHHAAEGGGLEAAKLLLERGADPTIRSDDGYLASDVATGMGRSDIYEAIQAAVKALETDP